MKDTVYEFGPFRLDLTERLLVREGKPLPLTAKVFDLLSLLVRNSGHLVEKSEIMTEIWSDSIVEENNLTVSISALRKALQGERQEEQRYIETVPKRGYRFVADVRILSGEGGAETGGARSNFTATGTSLAVLPLAMTGIDPGLEYLSLGIAETIINNLSQLSSLKVMALSTVSRYTRPDVDPLEVGRRIGVSAVLVGKVLQLDQELIIRMELVSVADGSQLWGERYHRLSANLMEIEEEISREVSKRLRLTLSPEERKRIGKRHTENIEAHHLYLRGRYFWSKYTVEGMKKGIEYFQQAIRLDPNYALAYAGLADSYQRLSNYILPPTVALPKAKAAATKALDIDDTLGEAHLALGFVRMYYDHDWPGAERALRRAAELSPQSPLIHQRYATFLMFMGRFDEALAEHRVARELDPLSLTVNTNLGTNLLLMQQYDEAIDQLRRTLELDPHFYLTRVNLGMAHVYRGEFDEGLAQLGEADRIDKNQVLSGLIGYTYARSGRKAEALKVLEELKEESRLQYVSPYSFVLLYLGLGETEEVFRWLEKTYEERNDLLVWLKVGPELNSIRSDPRFIDLLQRVGFSA